MEREDWLHWCVVGSGRIAGSDYLATAAHFAAESSTGTNVNVCTTDDVTKSVDALVYHIDPVNEEMIIAFPTMLFVRMALDQSSRYAGLPLVEEDLIIIGKHVLVAYIMMPIAGYDYPATAAHFAAESSTGTKVNVCTTGDFTKSVDARVYYF